MGKDVKHSDFKRISVKDLEHPREGGAYWLYKNQWWAIDENDCTLWFRGRSPQCNSDKRIVESLIENPHWPAVKARHIEYAYRPLDRDERW